MMFYGSHPVQIWSYASVWNLFKVDKKDKRMTSKMVYYSSVFVPFHSVFDNLHNKYLKCENIGRYMSHDIISNDVTIW